MGIFIELSLTYLNVKKKNDPLHLLNNIWQNIDAMEYISNFIWFKILKTL